jgi:hypothetical protein
MSRDFDRQLLDLVRQAVVPAGHRPESPEQVEAMLRACADATMTDEKLQRMLRKINGLLPIGERPEAEMLDSEAFEKSLTEEQRELVALHKAQGSEMPPEIRALLQRFREEAKRREPPPSSDGGTDVGRP